LESLSSEIVQLVQEYLPSEWANLSHSERNQFKKDMTNCLKLNDPKELSDSGYSETHSKSSRATHSFDLSQIRNLEQTSLSLPVKLSHREHDENGSTKVDRLMIPERNRSSHVQKNDTHSSDQRSHRPSIRLGPITFKKPTMYADSGEVKSHDTLND